MKNIAYLFIICTITLASCGGGKSDKNETSTDPSKANAQLLETYRTFVKGLDTTKASSSLEAAKKYNELFKGQASAICDSAYEVFESFYTLLAIKLSDLQEKDTTNLLPLVTTYAGDSAPKPSAKLIALNNNLKENGFEVSASEGMAYIAQSRGFISKWFYDLVSPEMKAFLNEIKTESESEVFSDGGISIEANEFVRRLIFWQDFSQKTPNFIFKEKVSVLMKIYLTTFFQGTDNSPVIDYSTKKISEYFAKMYDLVKQKYAGSETDKLLKPFYEAILIPDKAKADKLLADYRSKGYILQ